MSWVDLLRIVEAETDPLGHVGDHAVAGLTVAVGVGLLFAVGGGCGPVVGPAHESFALNWCESANCVGHDGLGLCGGECFGNAVVAVVACKLVFLPAEHNRNQVSGLGLVVVCATRSNA